MPIVSAISADEFTTMPPAFSLAQPASVETQGVPAAMLSMSTIEFASHREVLTSTSAS
jgi:hypothetical protein